ncbi:MAG TPA: hypothetical protein VHI55_13360 [Gaiellaceae bacterium]|jgi:hypothetical protein|nr:hypothetical protein [Gaiellaceae bacterium]
MTELARQSDVFGLVARMEEAGALTPVGLDLSERTDLSFRQFEALARFIDRVHDGTKWWAADPLIEAEIRRRRVGTAGRYLPPRRTDVGQLVLGRALDASLTAP